MRTYRAAAVLASVAAITVLGAVPAYAAPPSNDTPGGATVIDVLPFDDSVTIDEATTDALDATLNLQCGAPATEGSVWYRFDAAEDGGLIVDVSGSSFTAGALVTLGDPAEGLVLTCGPDAIVVDVAAGQSYFIMAFSDTPGVSTGTLVLHAEAAPPPPTIDVTVDPTGTFDSKTGAATVSGTVTCEGVVEFASVEIQLTQSVGRFKITGFGSVEALCDGVTHPWSAVVVSDNGKFSGGRAVSVTFAIACGPFFCGEDFEEATIKLRRR